MLEVKDLNFSFATKVILKEISFSLKPGEILFVQGDNGSGKTTLLKNLTRELRPTSGTIVHNDNFFYLAAEHNGLFLDMPAYEQLAFWAHIYKVNPDETKVSLSDWGLHDQYLMHEIAVKKFSTGMKRKLALARAQLSRAELFILDEPCNGLDEKSTAQFRKWCLQTTTQRKSAFIVVSHDKTLLEGCDHNILRLGKN